MNRYDRQIKYPTFGLKTQNKLQQLHVLIVGVGALGSGIAEQLTRCGVGKLTLIDKDIVTLSNLHRQSGYIEEDAKEMRPKVSALKMRLHAMNHEVNIIPLNVEVTSENILCLMKETQPDMVLDGLDDYETRFLVNEATQYLNIPYIYSAVIGSQVSVFPIDAHGPCLQCLMPESPETYESCDVHGVLPPAVHIASSMAVAELMHYLMTGTFTYTMKYVDIYKGTMKTTSILELKEPRCPVCSARHFTRLMHAKKTRMEVLCGGVIQVRFDAKDFQRHLSPNIHIIQQNPFVKQLKFEQYTMTFFQDGRLLIYGCTDKQEAAHLTQSIFKSSHNAS